MKLLGTCRESVLPSIFSMSFKGLSQEHREEISMQPTQTFSHTAQRSPQQLTSNPEERKREVALLYFILVKWVLFRDTVKESAH